MIRLFSYIIICSSFLLSIDHSNSLENADETLVNKTSAVNNAILFFDVLNDLGEVLNDPNKSETREIEANIYTFFRDESNSTKIWNALHCKLDQFTEIQSYIEFKEFLICLEAYEVNFSKSDSRPKEFLKCNQSIIDIEKAFQYQTLVNHNTRIIKIPFEINILGKQVFLSLLMNDESEKIVLISNIADDFDISLFSKIESSPSIRYSQTADSLVENKEFKLAINYYEKAVEEDPLNYRAQIWLDLAPSFQTKHEEIKKARRLYKSGSKKNIGKAYDILDKHKLSNLLDAQDYYILGRIMYYNYGAVWKRSDIKHLSKIEKYNKALANFTRAMRRGHTKAAKWYRLTRNKIVEESNDD